MGNQVNFWVVTINGLIDAFNPCAIGVFIATITLFVSMRKYKKNILIFGLFYILTMYLTYLLIGLGILKAVHLFGIHNFFGWLSAIALIVMGILQFSPKMKCLIPKEVPKEASILAGVTFGFLVGLCEFPCSGGIYLATIGYIGIQNTFWSGLFMLMWYNLMFVLPLIVIFALAYNVSRAKKIASYTSKIQSKFKNLGGWVMIALGIAMLAWLIIKNFIL